MQLKSSFGAFESKMRAENLPQVAVDTFRHYYEQLSDGATGILPRSEIDPVRRLPDSAELEGFGPRGAEALARTVLIKLNGGLGTSMGMTRPKSLLPVKDGLSFLDITARQVLHLRRQHGCELPLVLMNSFRTQGDSIQALSRYEDLATSLPADFLQHRVPKILASDLSPAEWPGDAAHEWCPPGHGDIYTALLTSRMLPTLLDRGFEFAFVSNSDNLGAIIDLGILGWFAAENIPFLMEVADRTEADRKGGHLARLKDGRLVLREVAQCPPDEMDSFQDISLYSYFNTNTLWANLRDLARVLRERNNILGLPMIRNEKTVDPTDDSSPRVYQLETAMGSAISVFEGARAIRVPRERFLPVKTTNDLLTVRSDAYVMTEDHRVVPAPERTPPDPVIDLDPAHYRRIGQFEERFPEGPPSLVRCRRLRIRGDIRFGRGVVFRGEVSLEHPGGEPRTVPDGEVFD